MATSSKPKSSRKSKLNTVDAVVQQARISTEARLDLPEFSTVEAAEEFIRLKEAELELREGLPFLYGWKWYPWAREFFESTSKINLLCAANQISKSSTQIRKCIHWATNPKLWPSLWTRRPVQFWYLYPSAKQVKAEFETKWVQFLPRGKYKTSATLNGQPNYYAWEAEWIGKELYCIDFHVAGIKVYFKTYTQDVQNLQTGTVDALFCDEELPVELYEELMFRLSASDGYFHMVFTATLGQEFWRQVLEPEEHEEKLLPEASKWCVSMYDCMKYEDGTPSHWTAEKIAMVKARCSSKKEVLRRIYGRFVRDDGGLKYESFDIKRHFKPLHPLPPNWLIYSGVDPGSGGKHNHPAAICFVAVSPDFRQGRVFLGWRGDKLEETSAGDVIGRYRLLKGKMVCVGEYYDWADKDFDIIQSRLSMGFQPADKSHTNGEQILNTLFRNDMLFIYDTPELRKLGGELASLRKDQPKNKAKDDFADALRYAVTRVPWDWTAIQPLDAKEKLAGKAQEIAKSPLAREIDERRAAFMDRDPEPGSSEFDEWNALYE